jgi:putative FmdB family regulatory protein
MPLYSYYCVNCDASRLEMRRMDERESKPLPTCDRCKKEMKFEISGPPMAIVKNPAAG